MTQETTTPPHAPTAGPPLLAGRYELGAVLGRGGMATVHVGRDVVLDRDVAIKVFPIDASQATSAARFEQEARLLARLAHPGLVTVFDAGIDAAVADAPRPFLVMELVTGPTLAERIATEPLTPAQTSALAAELASALGHIHRRDIVHRDVKPANILLAVPDSPDEPTRAKLTDFGIARLVDGGRLTLTGHTLGTANYLSPEQLTGSELGPATDIYSLGLVLLECLTGNQAYPGHGAEAALVRLQRQPEIPGSVPEGWARLVRTMTASDPQVRPSAAEVAVAATGLAGAAPPAASSDLPTGAPDGGAAVPFEPRTVPEFDAAGETVLLGTTDAPAATQVLPVPTMTPAELPVAPVPPAPHRRRWSSTLMWCVLAGAALLVVIVIGIAASGSSSPPPHSPSYPSVPGKLGSDLRQLQQDVIP